MRILIADDSDLVRMRLVDMLSDLEGIETIFEAQEGQEAIQLTRKLRPDVVILDIRMPKRNGLEVMSEIVQENYNPVIIILTNYPQDQYRKRCMEAGSDYFFDKSCEFERVTEICKQLVGSSESIKRQVNGGAVRNGG
ncbi:MAG: response regulator transcription factor [Gemmatimonadota bacterium]|nr:MAG: response regulator transcription factor [Gemmatimonadota bacterium]